MTPKLTTSFERKSVRSRPRYLRPSSFFAPSLEPLESRKLLSIAPATVTGTHFEFESSPTGTHTAGDNLGDVVIDIKDQSGNLVTSDSSTYELDVETATVTFQMYAVHAQNGVITLSNFNFATVGTYHLSIIDPSSTIQPTTSFDSFTITPGAPSFLAFLRVGGIPASTQEDLIVRVYDHDNNRVITDNSTPVTFTILQGTNVIATQTITDTFGQAALQNVSLTQPGQYTLVASSPGFSTITTNFQVVPAPPSHLVFLSPPADSVAGPIPNIIVAVEDAFGNIVTSDHSVVTLTSAQDPLSSLQGVTAIAVNGIATFSNLSLTTANTYYFSAFDGSVQRPPTVSFTVSPTNVTHLGFSIGTSPTYSTGLQFPFKVVLYDNYNNTIYSANYPDYITVAATNHGVISGTTTVSLIEGMATFNNISFDSTGNYALTASDGVDAPVSTGTLTVVPGSAAHLAFLTQPPSAINGNLGDISIAVEDDFGNIITSDNSTISLKISTGGKIVGPTSVRVKNGIATFHNLTIQNGGLFHLTASDKILTSATSSSFINNAHLSVIKQSTSIVAGTDASLTVALETTYNRILNIGGSTITLTLTSAPAGVPTGTTYTAQTTAGRATFSIPLTKTGNYIFTASDGTPVTVAKSHAVTVTPAAPASLQFITVPQTGSFIITPSSPLPPVTVGLYDQFGNLCINFNNAVTLTTVFSIPGISPTSLTVKAKKGVATFSEPLVLNASQYIAASGTLSATYMLPQLAFPFPIGLPIYPPGQIIPFVE